LEREADGRLLAKLAANEWEVNVRLSGEDLAALGDVRAASWNQRRTVHAGESAGAPVFWASEGDQGMLLIGDDDETWDVAFAVPLTVIDEIVREGRRLTA
jgi:hypothetical protein